MTGFMRGMFPGFIADQIFELMGGLVERLIGGELNMKIHSHQGIQESIKNAFKIGLINIIFLILIFVPIVEFIIFPIINQSNTNDLSSYLYKLIIFYIFYTILIAIEPVLKYLSLRITIYLKNYAPWNYAKFLDYATDKLFLQRVGGGYRFVHRMLQEYFVEIYSKDS